MSILSNLGRVFDRSKGPWERRLLVWGVVFAVGAVVVITAAYYFDHVTESAEFCGLLCHSNTPQYVAYEVSTHAEVECGVCHIGPGLLPKVMAKVYGVGELYMQLTNTYERPIEPPVKRLLPTDVMCEQCHWPQKSYGDQLYSISSFADDEENSETITSLALRVGGDGGAHWHLENPVFYVSTDHVDQEIPWVSVVRDGQTIEYRAADSSLTAAELEQLPRQEMDCLDCHSRPAHDFRKPERRVDEALAAGAMDSELPYLKREAIKLLSASYPTQEAGLKAMEELAQFYRSEYPDVYTAQKEAVDQAVETLQEIYRRAIFPEMRLTWEVYPNNLGHTDFPGCFRCHDGEHVNAQGEAIPSSCSLCHSIPAVAKAGQRPDPSLIANLVAQAEGKPDSHREADFFRDHRILANDSCADCHGSIEFGADNTGFCANEVCHGSNWQGPDLEAGFTHPAQLADQHAQVSCNECHQGERRPSIEDCATCHTPRPTPHFGDNCSQCHTMDGWKASVASWLTDAPSEPHGVELASCLLCHGEDGVRSAPASHDEFAAESCAYCHESAPAADVPTIPHIVRESDTCLICHSEGDLKPASAAHQGISAETCAYCHQSGTAVDVPAIPHLVSESVACLTCHSEGELKPASAMHQWIPAEGCVYCHESVPPEGVPTVPHDVEGRSNCLACHDAGRLEPVPDDHEGRTDESCLLCHESD